MCRFLTYFDGMRLNNCFYCLTSDIMIRIKGLTADTVTPGKGNTGFRLIIFRDVTCCFNHQLCLWFKAGRELLSLCLQLCPQSIMSPFQANAAFRWRACQGLLLSPCYSWTGFQGANAHDWLTWNETPSLRITSSEQKKKKDLVTCASLRDMTSDSLLVLTGERQCNAVFTVIHSR